MCGRSHGVGTTGPAVGERTDDEQIARVLVQVIEQDFVGIADNAESDLVQSFNPPAD